MKIHVTDGNGREHALDALEGWRVMEIIRDAGLPIRADCGGACACATCHVYVAPEWAGRLMPKSPDEEDMLDSALTVGDYSRLSCQIIFTPELDGLRLRLAADAIRED